MVPDALVPLETLDVVANVPDDELPVRAAADEDGRLQRVPRKCLFKWDSQFHIHCTVQSGASYLSQGFVMFFHVSCEGLPGQ